MKKMRNVIIIILWGVLLLFLGTEIWGRLSVLEEEQKEFDRLRALTNGGKSEGQIHKSIVENGNEEKEMLIEYRQLYQENPDFVGWIVIEETKIDYPVMQTLEDREYYLHRDFKGDDSFAGVPFVGSGNLLAGNEDIFIYGHNMRNKTMFAELMNYKEKVYWEEHSVIILDTLWEHQKYMIFSVFHADEKEWSEKNGLFSSNNLMISKKRAQYLEEIKEKSIYETGLEPEIHTRLIFLVTCSYQKNNERFVIASYLVD